MIFLIILAFVLTFIAAAGFILYPRLISLSSGTILASSLVGVTLLIVVIGLYLLVVAVPISAETSARNPAFRDFDDTTRFIFYSVLEGCYEDGLSNRDVDQILMKTNQQRYYHFIYACPVCTPTIWALETYRQRPQRFYSLLSPASTFSAGLPDILEKQLFSEDSRQRLVVINLLIKRWIEHRMDDEHLSSDQRKALNDALEKKRKQSTLCLSEYRKLEEQGGPNGLSQNAPAYLNLEECVVCDGALGKPMKLPTNKSNSISK